MIKHLPNFITWIRLVITLIIIYLWIQWIDTITLTILVLVWLFTDYLDGFVARKLDLSTQFWKQFDHYVDKFLTTTLFVIIAIEVFPYSTVVSLLLLISVVLLTARDFYIWRLKTHYTTMPVLKLAKRKTTLQCAWIILYFLWFSVVALFVFLWAVICSLISWYGYWAAAKWWRSSIEIIKLKSFWNVLLGKRTFISLLHGFPTVDEFKILMQWKIVEAVIVDLDGTVVSFDEDLNDSVVWVLQEYIIQGVHVVIYSNTANHERLERIKKQWFDVYTWSYAKPHAQWYNELAKEFWITLEKSVMIGDSPIADLPYVEPQIVLWSILVKPIKPHWKNTSAKAWVHYWFSRFLQLFVRKTG